jgi:hypothetical protein
VHSYWRKSTNRSGKLATYYELSCQLTTFSMEQLADQLIARSLRESYAKRTVGLISSSLQQRSPFSGYFIQGYRDQTFRLSRSLRRLGSIETVAAQFEFLRPLGCSESAHWVRGSIDQSLRTSSFLSYSEQKVTFLRVVCTLADTDLPSQRALPICRTADVDIPWPRSAVRQKKLPTG